MADKYKNEVTDPGDKASKLAHEICVKSHNNCSAVDIIPIQSNNFRGAVDFRWKKHILEMMIAGQMSESPQNDGAGGKLQFHTLVGTPEVMKGAGWEPIVMCADDIARSGGFSAIMVNDLNTNRITEENFHLFKSLLQGYGNALTAAKLVNPTGEIAIMKHSITAFSDEGRKDQAALTWSGLCIGLSHEEKKIDGSGIVDHMPIVGFWEPGYRCNGGTFFTNLILAKFAPMHPDQLFTSDEAIEFAKKLAVPSQSYAKFLSLMNGWLPDGNVMAPVVNMVGIAHITGGGIWGKFSELLPAGIGADLNNMPKPADILLTAQEISWNLPDELGLKLTDIQAHGTLHGGCGMMTVCATEEDAKTLIKAANTEGIKASRVGETISSEKNEIVIHSQFKEGRVLSSEELKKK